MARELFTSWGEYQAGIDRLLALANKQILIWDPDLSHLKLDGGTRLEALKQVLAGHNQPCLRIVIQDADPLVRQQPRLMELLGSYHHVMTVQQSGEQLAGLRDAMLLVDGKHGLIRFDRDHPRSKLLIDENEALLPYRNRFEAIWLEGGTPVSATTLGL